MNPCTVVASLENDKRPAQPTAGSSFSSPAKEVYAMTKNFAPEQLAIHRVRRRIDIETTEGWLSSGYADSSSFTQPPYSLRRHPYISA